jgi:ABC-2 type transport system ATP-binding protein
MSSSAIETHDLVKTYGRGVRALDGLSFSVPRGVIFGLLGPNGAGKTTTLKILTTLIRPTSGRASVAGVDVVDHPLEVRRRMVVVIQESAADLLLTVRDNLTTYGRFHGLDRRAIGHRAADVMARFGLEGEATRKVMDLSGGFRRRVQVAKAFMVDAPVVFLDEFSTGMDPLLKRSVMAALREQAERGRTIVLTTQILSEAEDLCDEILILDRGREIARGDLPALKLLTQNVYEVTMTFDRLPEGIEAELEARQPLRLTLAQNTVSVALKEDETRVLALVADLAARGRVLRVEVSGASLEDVFLELTTRGGRP